VQVVFLFISYEVSNTKFILINCTRTAQPFLSHEYITFSWSECKVLLSLMTTTADICNITLYMYAVSQKSSTPSDINNFVSSQQIFKILSVPHSTENFRQNYPLTTPKTRRLWHFFRGTVKCRAQHLECSWNNLKCAALKNKSVNHMSSLVFSLGRLKPDDSQLKSGHWCGHWAWGCPFNSLLSVPAAV